MKTQDKHGAAIPQQLAVRLDKEMHARLIRVVTALRRSKTSVIEEGLETILPELERQFPSKLKQAA